MNYIYNLDIQFFDESIEAKINRYTFRLHKRDTPFLLDSSQKHTKTFVAASVDVDNLTNIQYPNDGTEEWINKTQKITQDKSGRNIFHYHNFPKLKYDFSLLLLLLLIFLIYY